LEEGGFLRHEGDLAAVGAGGEGWKGVVCEGDGAGGGVVEAFEEGDQG